ncbi:hypothetical protein P8S54_03485 [Thiomicrospira sp. R3]|uniref:hypothetical protein n=1 Tax=Thiomicrospira sp. R3 TaxID=3035472 RepID=UPI00259B778B|nr:hypothetical protein [Thiomicrospira sp. R3]WFE69372.1 hypothetical protein P8S54_03485 [Thiomicrospira sp. R3]
MKSLIGLLLVSSTLIVSGCSNQTKIDAATKKADQRTAQQIESTERGAREAHHRLDQQ